MKEFLKNKKIFLTGAGSIGTGILNQLLKYDIHSIRVFDNSEYNLFKIKRQYKGNGKIKLLLGDIKDKDRLRTAMKNVNVVFHTAALKHVSFCEQNPIDAVKTNVISTQNIIDVALEESIDNVILISSDKAVDPINVMGTTKLLAERLISSTFYYNYNKTIFTSIRLGNVIGSSGSVIQIFENQLKNGKRITITDKNMVRYMMLLEEAIDLSFNALKLSIGGEVFILKMPCIKIFDLAETMMDKFGIKANIDIIGKDTEEKLTEDLVSEEEIAYIYENDIMYVRIPRNDSELANYYKSNGFKKCNSITTPQNLTKEEINGILNRYYENLNNSPNK